MGRVWNTRQGHIDTLKELVGIKSGLVLVDKECLDLLESTHETIAKSVFVLSGAIKWWQGNKDESISVRVENIEANIIYVMYSIGAIRDIRTSREILMDFLFKELHIIPGKCSMEQFEILSRVQSFINFTLFAPILLPNNTDTKFEEVVMKKFKESQDYGEFCRRHLMERSFPMVRSWNGLIPISDLFESEKKPINTISEQYFDQRYIDYLNAQPNKLQDIQWRQFEYLTAEYFRRHGYHVEVGRGRGDGGKDIIARKEEGIVGPDLIVVQCKRYAESNPVDVDTVKAFWTTLNEEGATKGLIVTTSRLTSGAKTFCQAHQYRLTSAERETVKLWLKNLASPRD